MKRVNSFLIAAFVAASSMFVVSCDGDDDDPDNAPKIEVKCKVNGGNATVYTDNTDIENTEGTQLCFDVVVTMGKSKVNYITVTSSRFSQKVINIDKSGLFASSIESWTMSTDTDKDNNPYGEYCASIGNDNEILTFTAIDSKKRDTEVVITVKKKDPQPVTDGDNYISYSPVSISFGCQAHKTNPSFYSISKGQAMMLSAAKTNPGDVDFIFYNSSGIKVGCPSGAVKDVAFSGTNTISTLLNTRNTVNFLVVDKPSEGKYLKTWWDGNITSVGSATATEVSIANDKVVFFKKGTTTGAFLVKTVGAAANDAAITVDIIVKQ